MKEVISNYPERKKDVIIITNVVNRGVASARNTAFHHSTGEYVIAADSDDWVESDAYLMMYNKAKTDNADIVICGYYNEYGDNRVASSSVRNYNNVEDTLKDSLSGILHNGLWNKMMRRELLVNNHLECLEGADMLEDTYLTTRVLFYSHRVSFINKPFLSLFAKQPIFYNEYLSQMVSKELRFYT